MDHCITPKELLTIAAAIKFSSDVNVISDHGNAFKKPVTCMIYSGLEPLQPGKLVAGSIFVCCRIENGSNWNGAALCQMEPEIMHYKVSCLASSLRSEVPKLVLQHSL